MAIFAKYDGVDGEAQDELHARWIDILSFAWGAARSGDGVSGSGRERGAATVDDFVLTFAYDKAAPKLLEKCLEGEVLPTLEVELTRSTGEQGRATYLEYTLTNVTLTSYHVSGSAEEGVRPTVVVHNKFEEIKVTYTEYGEDGTKLGNVEAEYDAKSAEAKVLEASSKKKTKKKSKKKK